MEMFAFVGKLMGIAIRSKEYMALNIPSIIWKLLANDIPTLEDLEGIDFSLVKSIELLRTIESTGIDSASFSMTFFETFSTTSSDDKVVELIPDGENVDVTFENRSDYCDLVLNVSDAHFPSILQLSDVSSLSFLCSIACTNSINKPPLFVKV